MILRRFVALSALEFMIYLHTIAAESLMLLPEKYPPVILFFLIILVNLVVFCLKASCCDVDCEFSVVLGHCC